MDEAENIIKKLGLQPLPGEGGFFRQTWVGAKAAGTDRPAGSAIYFLLTPQDFSALHRLETDEVWHFYAGDPVRLLQLDPQTRQFRVELLGADVLAGQSPQHVVPAGVWQGARLVEPVHRGWALLGCTLAPGWEARDFTLGLRAELLAEYPAAAADIMALTR